MRRDSDGVTIVFVTRARSEEFDRENLSEKSWLDTGYLPSNLLDSLAGRVKFDALWNLHPEDHHKVVMYGKTIPIPRWQQSYLQNYSFSGAVNKKIPLPSDFEPFLTWANTLGLGNFNQFLVNWYQDGSHYIGSHADDTKQLVPDSPIVTITLCRPGELRTFRIRDRDKKS